MEIEFVETTPGSNRNNVAYKDVIASPRPIISERWAKRLAGMTLMTMCLIVVSKAPNQDPFELMPPFDGTSGSSSNTSDNYGNFTVSN